MLSYSYFVVDVCYVVFRCLLDLLLRLIIVYLCCVFPGSLLCGGAVLLGMIDVLCLWG